MPLRAEFLDQPAKALDVLEADRSREPLCMSVWDVIDMVCERPHSADARRGELIDDQGVTWWRVPIPAPGEPGPWRLYWRTDSDAALFGYIGA